MDQAEWPLSGDKAIEQPQYDQLGYATFAKHLAESVARMSPPEGFVIALHGPWGSGKTSVLNLVEYYLDHNEVEKRVIVVHFNPWWFSGQEDLARRFFEQLQVTLASKLKAIATELRKRLAAFALTVSEAPLPYASAGKAAASVVGPKLKDVPQLKRDISELLRQSGNRILIVIDDIDRLTAEEIRQLFRVIKAVADFPNVVYLLAFDKRVAIAALSTVHAISGEEYLEKIIQLPLELPPPDESGLQTMLIERLNHVLAGTPEELMDQTLWNQTYHSGLAHFLTTPRDVVRLTNGLAVTYAAVAGEANPFDFIALETLRIFCPVAYDTIRKNQVVFARVGGSSYFTGTPDTSDKAIIEEMLGNVSPADRDAANRLVFRLFPRLEALFGGSNFGSDWSSSWRRARRVCSPDVFPLLFRLSPPEGSISRAEMASLVALATDPTAFAERLLSYTAQRLPNDTTRLRSVLDLTQDHIPEDITVQWLPGIMVALFAVADRLLQVQEKRQGLFDIDNDIRLGRLTRQIMDALDPDTRFAALQDAIQHSDSVSFLVQRLVVLGQEHGKHSDTADPPERRHVTSEQLSELEAIVLEKIRTAAQDGRLLSTPQLSSVLYYWLWQSGEEEVRAWVDLTTKDSAKLPTLLESFGGYAYLETPGQANFRAEYRLDPASLAPFIELKMLASRIAELDPQHLTTSQALARTTFLDQFEHGQPNHEQKGG